MKMPCKFCQKKYNLREDLPLKNYWTINCQACLVDFYWREVPTQPLELIEICYRLKDPDKLFDQIYLCLKEDKTLINLWPKQKKFKASSLVFDGIIEVQPKDALKLAHRYKNLMVFS